MSEFLNEEYFPQFLAEEFFDDSIKSVKEQSAKPNFTPEFGGQTSTAFKFEVIPEEDTPTAPKPSEIFQGKCPETENSLQRDMEDLRRFSVPLLEPRSSSLGKRKYSKDIMVDQVISNFLTAQQKEMEKTGENKESREGEGSKKEENDAQENNESKEEGKEKEGKEEMKENTKADQPKEAKLDGTEPKPKGPPYSNLFFPASTVPKDPKERRPSWHGEMDPDMQVKKLLDPAFLQSLPKYHPHNLPPRIGNDRAPAPRRRQSVVEGNLPKRTPRSSKGRQRHSFSETRPAPQTMVPPFSGDVDSLPSSVLTPQHTLGEIGLSNLTPISHLGSGFACDPFHQRLSDPALFSDDILSNPIFATLNEEFGDSVTTAYPNWAESPNMADQMYDCIPPSGETPPEARKLRRQHVQDQPNAYPLPMQQPHYVPTFHPFHAHSQPETFFGSMPNVDFQYSMMDTSSNGFDLF